VVGTVPVFINTRDRVSTLRPLVEWLERAGGTHIVIVDNASTYEPLLDYLDSCPHEVVRLTQNLGHTAPWLSGAIGDRVAAGQRYVETDPDVVPDEHCPSDAIEWFGMLLDRHPDVHKVGFGLRTDDLPRQYRHAEAVRRWESRFWTDEVEKDVFRAPIDTTFALHRAEAPLAMEPALRTGGAYLARHLPWYADSLHPSPEQQYYLEHAETGINSWDGDEISNHIASYVGVHPQGRPRTMRERIRRLRRR
jgi:hypothetical protein